MTARRTYQVYSYSNDSHDINFRQIFIATRFMMTWKKFASNHKNRFFSLYFGIKLRDFMIKGKKKYLSLKIFTAVLSLKAFFPSLRQLFSWNLYWYDCAHTTNLLMSANICWNISINFESMKRESIMGRTNFSSISVINIGNLKRTTKSNKIRKDEVFLFVFVLFFLIIRFYFGKALRIQITSKYNKVHERN